MNKDQNDTEKKTHETPETPKFDKVKFSDVDSNRGNGTHRESSRTNR
jgi:hypothetical protein